MNAFIKFVKPRFQVAIRNMSKRTASPGPILYKPKVIHGHLTAFAAGALRCARPPLAGRSLTGWWCDRTTGRVARCGGSGGTT